MLGTVNILLRGIPFIYQGQEIGMQNEIWSNIHDYNDISTIDQYNLAREAGLSDAEALEVCGKMSRDNARTPVQWNAQVNAGLLQAHHGSRFTLIIKKQRRSSGKGSGFRIKLLP